MITFDDLNKSVQITHYALEDCTRFYAVGDRLIARLYFSSEYARQRIRRRRRGAGFATSPSEVVPPPPPQMQVVARFELEDKDGYFELSDCTARELVAFAEIQGTIEKWTSGELLELPPSNATPFKPTDE